MSIYSTETVTRAYAIGKIIETVMQSNNEKLADVLFQVYGQDHFANYFVVDELPRKETDSNG